MRMHLWVISLSIRADSVVVVDQSELIDLNNLSVHTQTKTPRYAGYSVAVTFSALFSEWPACSRMAKEAVLDSPVTSRHIPSHDRECWPIKEGNCSKTMKMIRCK